jgi:hypothetical protein
VAGCMQKKRRKTINEGYIQDLGRLDRMLFAFANFEVNPAGNGDKGSFGRESFHFP